MKSNAITYPGLHSLGENVTRGEFTHFTCTVRTKDQLELFQCFVVILIFLTIHL